jgi:hypothetical protein
VVAEGGLERALELRGVHGASMGAARVGAKMGRCA